MGCDSMVQLGISLITKPEGVKAVKLHFQMVQYSRQPLLLCYQWWLAKGELSKALTKVAQDVMSLETTHFMHVKDLHCTTRVHAGLAQGYKQEWYNDHAKDLDCLTITDIFGRTAASISLTPSQRRRYQMVNAHSHISLAKFCIYQWSELGNFILNCIETDDWQSTNDFTVALQSAHVLLQNAFYCQSAGHAQHPAC